MTSPTDFIRSVDLFSDFVARIGPDDWRRQTPCDEWDVRDLVNHMAYEALWMPPLMAGLTIEEVGDRFEGDVLGEDPHASWTSAASAAVESVSGPDALERTVHLSFGETPAGEYVAQMFADHLIHAWDLGAALGLDPDLPDDLVASCATWFSSVEDLYRQSGAIAERVEIPDAAANQARLLAAFGRDPAAW